MKNQRLEVFVDGKLHVQLYFEDILSYDNHGYIEMCDKDGNRAESCNFSFGDDKRVGSYEEIIYDISPEDIENYKAYGFGPFTEVKDYGKYKSAEFAQNTDGKDIIFEIIQPLDMECAYGKYLAKYGRGVYNVIFEQNPEFNNVIGTLFE